MDRNSIYVLIALVVVVVVGIWMYEASNRASVTTTEPARTGTSGSSTGASGTSQPVTPAPSQSPAK